MKSFPLLAFCIAIFSASVVSASETSPRSTISLSRIAVKGADWYSIKVSKKSQMTIVIRDHQINLLDVPQNFDYAITLDHAKNRFYKSLIAFWKTTSSGKTLIDAIGLSDTGKVEFASKPAFESLQTLIKETEDKVKLILDEVGSQK